MIDKGIRVNLIKKIAKRLSLENQVDGDLVLQTFGIQYGREWHYSDEYEFYVSALSSSKDISLTQLHDYLFHGENLPQIIPVENDQLWVKGYFKVFISHSTTKKLLTSQIKSELNNYGIDCFVAHEDIEPTTQWMAEIKKALVSSNALVAIVCNEFSKSSYCDQEVGFALALDKLVIPIRLEKDPYGFMGAFQGVNAFQSTPAEIAASIVSILEKNYRTSDLLIRAKRHRLEVLVDDFLKSSNFGNSTELLRKIEATSNLPLEILEKIDLNWKKNDQVYGCRGIPNRLRKLFELYKFIPKEKIL